MRSQRGPDPVVNGLKEAEDAIGQVLTASGAVDLNPQNAYIRRLQHLEAQRYNLLSRSVGKEPNRYVRIGPSKGN
jgi:predicted RNA-binding protein Jag